MGEKKRRQALGLDRSRPARESAALIAGVLPYIEAIQVRDEDCHVLTLDIPIPLATHNGIMQMNDLQRRNVIMFAGMGRRDLHRKYPEMSQGSAPEKLEALLAGSQELIVERLQPLVDDAMSDVRNECGSGCSMCCHQDVDVAIPEAITIAKQLGTPDDPRRETIRRHAEGLRAGVPSGTAPCPLLGEDGKCSVYDVRPITCRMYYSTSRQRCHDALVALKTGIGDRNVDTYAEPQMTSRAHLASINGVCKDAGVQHGMVALSTAVSQILDDPTAPDRWAAGESVFEIKNASTRKIRLPKVTLETRR